MMIRNLIFGGMSGMTFGCGLACLEFPWSSSLMTSDNYGSASGAIAMFTLSGIIITLYIEVNKQDI